MTEKKFDPKPGDTIVTRSRGNWICSTREEIEKTLGDIAYKNYSIFAVNPQQKYSFMSWPDHTGEYPDSISWSIVEIIPAKKEEQMQAETEYKTPAQKAGFIIGENYLCIDDRSSSYTAKGAIYKFIEDDGSNSPYFEYVSGPAARRVTFDKRAYIELDCLVIAPNGDEETYSRTPHKHANLIIAWARGAVIQYYGGGEYRDCTDNNPEWKIGVQYRIKPEPKPDKVRYGNASVCLGVCNTSDYQDGEDNLKLTFDGKTGKLKAAEVI